MPISLLTTANTQERVIALPPTPSTHQQAVLTAVGNTVMGVITLTGTQPLTNNSVHAYCWYAALISDPTAAASSARVAFQWQFRDNTHTLIGSPTTVIIMSASSGAAGQPLNNPPPMPPGNVPMHIRLVPPANTAEIVMLGNVLAINGSPSVNAILGWGVDITNNGTTGDIGGSGLAAQSASNLNEF